MADTEPQVQQATGELGDVDARRRRALVMLAGGLGLVVGGSLVPERWAKPVVESIVAPAHATFSNFSVCLEQSDLTNCCNLFPNEPQCQP